jgi:hypothetical protein
MNLVDSAQLERFSDASRRVDLLEPEFRMRVQVAPECRELWMEARNVREGAAVGLQAPTG